MGRYKFPGKPTKNVNKKRVNVLLYATIKTKESVGYNNEFSSIQTNQANAVVNGETLMVNSENNEVSSTESCSKLTILTSNSSNMNKVDNEEKEYESLSILLSSNNTTPNTFMYNYKKFIVRSSSALTKTQTRSMKDIKRLIKRKKRIQRHDSSSNTIKFSPCSNRKSIYARKRQIKDNNRINKFSPRIRDREKTSLVGKFVLPSKSLHSSRLIIPNKRFINNEQIYQNVTKTKQTQTNKKNNKTTTAAAAAVLKSSEEQTTTNDNEVIIEKHSDDSVKIECDISNKRISMNADMNDVVVIDSSSLNNNNPRPSSKLVLRKARLQLNTQTTENMDCPFSNNTLAPSPPGTVTCGVCGAVRFYKFVKQARKFNIYSCESCRKFISKMIKRLASPKNSQVPKLICHKGQGMCHVPPIVRSQQWKLLRCAYKARCPACWLKMCLQSFQMPTQLKTNLINMLPDNMRTMDETPQNNEIQSQNHVQQTNLTLNLWQPQCTELNETINQTSNSQQQQEHSQQEKQDTTIANGKIDSLSSRMDTLLNKTKVRHERPRSRLKKNVATTSTANETQQQNSEYKRQKLDIKGPRVKHVCRSASIVLGQPLATFSSACSTDTEEASSGVCDLSNDTDSCIKCKTLSQEHCTEKQETVEHNLSTELIQVPPISICLSGESDCNVEETYPLKPSITIASDYFDNYDSEGKIYGSGFGLIGSEPFSIQAVCFYCGSAGQEQLVYCACCCEPYHCYCINESITQRYFSNFQTQKRKFLWKCSRCSICEQCGYAENKKISCKLCQCYFHPECMQENPDFPTICSSCLHCEDCGSENITNTILNTLLCLLCLKNRMKEDTCALCKKYDENNSSTKMFKCNTCKRFIHTSCENISNEACKILNYLPDQTVLTCCLCSPHKLTNWKDSLQMALKNGFHIVLRMLARSRTAKELMKWNLLKNVACSCRSTNHNNTTKNINFDSDVKVLIKANTEKTRTKSKDNNLNISLRNMQKKICIKECSVRIKNCLETKDKSAVFKIDDKCNRTSDTEKNDIDTTKKFCSKHNIMPIVLLLNIKKNINSNFYKSVEEFHFDVRRVLKRSLCLELLKVLDTILKETFPWYDPESLCEENEFRTNMFLNSSNIEQNNISSITCSTIISDDTTKAISNSSINFDTRTCVLCNKIGDSMPSLQGRLIYCGHNDWIHVNCAFWSSDVYEEIDCSLQNVHETIARSRSIDCVTCKEKGATVMCAADNCSEIYHFMCGRSANCVFVNSKLMYCSQHSNNESASTINGRDFELQRPIYVNIDIQKKKHVELSKVQFLIGSLTVTNLGTFFPPFSDTEEAIIPSEFVCSRLFWSTVEPWKIIKYNISTSVFIPTLKNIYQSEKNFTIDHSLPNEVIEEQMIEISKWNNEFHGAGNTASNSRDFQKDSTNITDDDKIVLQVLDHLIELTCNKEAEENCDDEPQNSTDILPPELKEAIFEDLPHDLLDGISMQDIFPKLMNYEDVISMDIKSSETGNINNNNIDIKTGLSKELIKDECFQTKEKKSDIFVNGNDFWMDPTRYSIQNLEDFVHNEKTITENVQQLKRSKSEVLTGFKKLSRTCNHQRSCSLTWSCKLDNMRASNLKKRKLCSSKTVSDIRNNLFMLLDGNSEKCNIPESIFSHPATIDKVRELKYCLEEKTVISSTGDRFKSHTQEIEQEKENKCRLWRNRARIVQTDGADDSSSSENDDESDSNDFETIKKQRSSTNTNDEPVQCDRCQCTYRTLSSYKKHLETCDYILSSDSDSDVSVQNEEIIANSSYDNISTKTINVSQTVTKTNMQVSVTCSTTTESSATKISNCDNINAEIICQNNVEIKSEPIDIKPIIKDEYISESLLRNNQQVNEIISNVENNTKLVLNAQNFIQQPQKMVNNKKVPIFKVSSVQRFSPEKKPNKTNIRKKITEKVMKVQNVPQNQIVLMNNNTRLQEVETNISTTPAVYFQHLPTSNLMPTYVDAFQHQQGQNLQCIATIVANDYKPQQTMVTPNIFLPGTLQTTGSNILNMSNTGYPVFSGLESQLQQPTVIGSLVNRPTNFQCGIMSAEQIVLGSIPNIGTIVNDSQNSLCFSSQPILYGFETIVQNTVMSTSQQFASTNLPGMLASNSSYSTTTTQVFHSSKIEPILDMNNSGYILLNNSSVPQVATTPITINQLPQLPPKPQTTSLVTTQLPIMDSQQPSYAIQIMPVCEPVMPVVEPVLVATSVPPKPEPNIESQICIKTETTKLPVHVEPMKPQCTERSIKPRVNLSTTSITLPIASHVNENKIPMNIVSPMPQTIAPTHISKPTNRVLPMQAVSPKKEFLKAPPTTVKIIPNNKIPSNSINKLTATNKILTMDPPHILNKFSETMEKIQETLQNDVESIQSIKCNKNKNNFLKLESASLKLVFQKQSHDGLYKISNKYVSKNKAPNTSSLKHIAKIDENHTTKEKNIEISEKENKIQSKTTSTSNNNNSNNNTNGQKIKINNNPNIVYNVQSQDGFDCSSTSLTDVWKNVFDAVQTARTAHNMPNLPNNAFKVINGLQLLGLKSNGLRYLIEQLPGAGNCMKYKPLCQKRLKYCQFKDEDNKLSFQAARCQPCIFTKQPYDMFSWLASKHRNPDYFNYVDVDSASRRSSVNLPMAMRFRQLKETSKHAVGVYRSSIHGRGLFCLRDIECGEMVIEYAGEVIRSTLTDKREKYYNSKGIGCYMFRVDDNLVVDATMKGNAARFINHSCDPNCYSRVVDILGHKHILIFALRKIIQGEELTYDYKFPFEEDKIPCTCGAKRCRKYLN